MVERHIASNSSCRSREDTLTKSLEQERTWKGLWEQSDSKLAERELQGEELFKEEGLHPFHTLE